MDSIGHLLRQLASGAHNSLDGQRIVAFNGLYVTTAAFRTTPPIRKIARAEIIDITVMLGYGYVDSIGLVDCNDFSNGTQDANSPDGDGFARFTECSRE